MASSIKRRVDPSNNNALDIFSNNLSTVSAGLENETGNYVISKGVDFSNPYFTIDTNNGDVTIANNLMVKGTTTISNTSTVNLETTNLSIGFKNDTLINDIKQVTNTNFLNYRQYANVFINSPFPFSNNSNIKFNGVKTVVGTTSKDYNILYSPNLFTNLYNHVNLVSNSAKNNNNNNSNSNFGFTNNKSPIFDYTSSMTSSSFYFKSKFSVHLGATLTSTINSGSTSISVNNTNGWDSTGKLLIAPNMKTDTIVSGIDVDSNSTEKTITVNDSSLFSVGDYVAGTNSINDLFVLGKIQSISNNTLTFSRYIPGTIVVNSNVYKLFNIDYTLKTLTSFIVPSLALLGTNVINPSSQKYLQIFSENSIIGNSDLFYFNNSVSSSFPYVVSISTVENDIVQNYCPIFDNSPPDIVLVGNQFFTLQFDATIINPNHNPIDATIINPNHNPINATFIANTASVGELQANTTNDGLFSLDFNFTDANNNDASKRICVGSNGSGSTTYTDSVYFTKMVDNNPTTYFSLDYANNRMQFKNGADIQNNVANQLLLNAPTSTKVTSTTNSTSPSTGSLIVAGGMGVNSDINVGGILNVNDTTDSTTTTNGCSVLSGGVGIGGSVNIGGVVNVSGNENVAGILNVTNTTVSSTSTDGAVVIGGGVGIGGAVNVGGTVNISGNENLIGTLNVSNATVSSSASTGAVVITGGVGIGGAVNITGNENLAGVLHVTNSTTSTTSSTGSVIVSGGIGVGENLNVGGIVNITGNENLTGILNVTNSTTSSSSSTGAVVVTGGVGIGGVVNIAGTSSNTALHVSNTNNSSTITDGSVVVDGGVGIAKILNVGGSVNITGSKSDIALHVTNINNSSTTTDGSAVFDGGVGIAKKLNVGDAVNITGNTSSIALHVTNTNDSSSITNGSSVFDGGVGIAKKLNVGGNLNVEGDFTLLGSQTTTSDQTLKTDIVPIDNALDKVLNMNGVYFNWIDQEKFNNRHQVGFLAQNVETVVPELVLTDNSGIKSVNYSQLVAVLVEAIKEQNNVIKQLKTDVELLKQKKTRVKKTKSTSDIENTTDPSIV